MKVIAKLNYLHISPRKVRAVVGVVKKLSLEDALSQLKFIPNIASGALVKLIKSAIANAENNFSLDASGLKISEFKVDGGPVFKRFRPASKGRAAPLRRRTSHITLVLEGQRIKADDGKKESNTETESHSHASEKVLNVKQEINKNKGQAMRNNSKKKGSGFVKRMFQRKAI